MGKLQKTGAIIVAAGESKRMGGMDKIWTLLGDKPVLARALEPFLRCDAIKEIVIVLNKKYFKNGRRLIKELNAAKPIKICTGGVRRQDSVATGLAKLNNCNWVVIHDGARPLVTTALVEQCLDAARQTGAAIVAVPVTDTIKIIKGTRITQTVPRHVLWAAQTPQVFRYDIITEAYEKITSNVTDDASLVEQIGYKVIVTKGSADNLKITTPDDLVVAECLLRKYDE